MVGTLARIKEKHVDFVNQRLQLDGEVLVENATTLISGANSLLVMGKIKVANLVGEFKLVADGKEVLNVASNGVHSFLFNTKRRMDFKEVSSLRRYGRRCFKARCLIEGRLIPSLFFRY